MNEDKCVKLEKKQYYYQVQMQLFMTNRQFCDLLGGVRMIFIWKESTEMMNCGMKCLARQNTFIIKMCIMPELACKYFSNNLSSTFAQED